MNRCEHTSQLTAYLLGDLPERGAAAVAAHLATCAECRATADALRETLALLREAFPAGEQDGPGPVLAAVRREKLLSVRPLAQVDFRKNWFARRHPLLTRAAVWVLVLGGLFAVLSAALFPAISNSPRAARRALERNTLKTLANECVMEKPLGDVAAKRPGAAVPASAPTGAVALGGGKTEDESGHYRYSGVEAKGQPRSEALLRDESGLGTERRTKERAAPLEAVAGKKVWKDADAPAARPGPAQPSGGKPATSATAQSDHLYRENLEKSETDTKRLADAPSGSGVPAAAAAATFSPAPAAFDSVSIVKSPIQMKGVYASRSPGARGAIHGGGGGAYAKDEKLAVSALEPDLPVEFIGGALAAEAKQDGAGLADKTRLTIAVPKPQFTGTPKDIRSPNLEAAGARDVGPFTDYETVAKAKTTEGPQTEAWFGLVVAGRSLPTAGRAGEGRAEDVGWVSKELQEVVSDRNGVAAKADLGYNAESPSVQASVTAVPGEPNDLYAGVKIAALKRREPLPVNPFVAANVEPFSTFAMDVDTASYALTRQALRAGALPEPERVRTEEVVNAFDYGDTAPERTVFRVYQDGAQSPFGAGLQLLRIGVKGRRLGREEQRPAMLTFVIDVSGSMSQPDRIGFARLALTSLLEHVSSRDRIQIIAYSDHAQLVLEPVAATEKARVIAAFERLQCNGSTNLEEGLMQAYEQAAKGFVPGAENRVILLSDGVANLGADCAQEILDKVAANRKQGITCSVFGVGSGTYNDRMLEELANRGDGVYRFLDSEAAVTTAFVDDLAATLNTIAKDAKIQVEWNPAVVRQYRQLGYENRALQKEQFRDDTVDAGEVGSGQSVTALYELELAPEAAADAALGTVRIRYQRTDTGKVEEIEATLAASTVLRPAHAASAYFRVAASAAEFAELLRGSPHAAGGSFDAVADYLRPAVLGLSLDTRVKELLDLVAAAAALKR
jgi:Ca-activated chloride channel family protein